MKATIKAYNANIELFCGELNQSLSTDFPCDFFESHEEAGEWADDEVCTEIKEAENWDEIRERIITSLDRFTK